MASKRLHGVSFSGLHAEVVFRFIAKSVHR
jgi:hypothetical protein